MYEDFKVKFDSGNIAVIVVCLVIAVIFGPFAWKAAQTMEAQTLHIIVYLMVGLIFLVVLIGGLVLALRALADVNLRMLEQDDLDEARKANAALTQQIRMMGAVTERATRDRLGGSATPVMIYPQETGGATGYGDDWKFMSTVQDVTLE